MGGRKDRDRRNDNPPTTTDELRIDLHSHSTASDGVLSPTELIREAVRQQIDVLGLTDHDTMAGVPEAQAAADEAGIRFIPGVELNTDAPKGELHILGYCLSYEDEPFQRLLQRRQTGREERAQKMVERLRQIGRIIHMEDVRRIAQGGVIARPHIARALVEAGYANSVGEAFDKYVDEGKPGYVKREGFTAVDAIRSILDTGGVPVLAHPGRMADEGYIMPLVEAGLQGIECYYPEHTPEQTARYVKLAGQHNLVITGGSDYHGFALRADRRLGCVATPGDAAERLFERQRQLARQIV